MVKTDDFCPVCWHIPHKPPGSCVSRFLITYPPSTAKNQEIGEIHPCITYGLESVNGVYPINQQCPGCRVERGAYHHSPCPIERCPVCLRNLWKTCACWVMAAGVICKGKIFYAFEDRDRDRDRDKGKNSDAIKEERRDEI